MSYKWWRYMTFHTSPNIFTTWKDKTYVSLYVAIVILFARWFYSRPTGLHTAGRACSGIIMLRASLSRYKSFTVTLRALHPCGNMGTAPWASQCPNVKNYKRRLNTVWHKMLYRCTYGNTGLQFSSCSVYVHWQNFKKTGRLDLR